MVLRRNVLLPRLRQPVHVMVEIDADAKKKIVISLNLGLNIEKSRILFSVLI